MIPVAQSRSLDSYQTSAVGTDVSKGHDSASFLLLGLFGEAGSLLAEVKKRERDRTRDTEYYLRVREEIGDMLWYLSAVAARNGIRLSEIASVIITSRRKRKRVVHNPALSFADIQPLRKIMHIEPTIYLEWRLIDLADAVGQLVYDHRKYLKDRIRHTLVASFAEVLVELLSVANRVGVDLEESALWNLRKTRERWPIIRRLPRRFDNRYPRYEQLPRNIEVKIIEKTLNDGTYFVYQTCNDINIGDRLTDNIADPDDYRFHDVFHYAHAAVLGWSPVLRALFKTKRKSNKKVDESEDGARAILIEEGIAVIVFNYAKKNGFFANVSPGKVSFDLLKTIRSFVSGYEVAKVPYWAWEDAILQGYEAFRFLQEHRRGKIVMSRRRLTVHPL